MREKAATVAAEIARYLPDFTVHDVTHLDALWELVDLIGGDLELTPCEAFVLGGGLLTHDLAMTVAAYPGGREELRKQPLWRDSVAQSMRRKGQVYRTTTVPPEDLANEADRTVLRMLHAHKAREIPGQRWIDNTGREIRYLEDDGLRESFAGLIGEIAASHWWSPTQLREPFDKKIGAPTWCPSEWTIDPLRVACLLRAADAAHLDERRAPKFLTTVRRPSGIAGHHWLFQRRMQQAIREGEQLKFTSSVPFSTSEAAAWWVAVDALRMVDGELRSVDALLQSTGRPRFAARRVAAVDDLQALQTLVPVDGWRPVDTRVRVSDIPRLIERLGGTRLYGNDFDVPLRELIQNAADAVRARRYQESRRSDWGEICVATGNDEHGTWIEVNDNGLGMTESVLTGPLLDFGVSYWNSGLVCDEFPGLLAKGFQPVGEFGIGFFSVFMWATKVKVTTRSCRIGTAHTLVLEFESGLASPPLLRRATTTEHLVDGGTTVRVWLAQREEWFPSRFESLARKCEWLCPTLDVDLYAKELDASQPEQVIAAGDWLRIPPERLLERVTGEVRLEKVLTESALGNADFQIPVVLAMMEPLVDPESGETLGRACLRPPWLTGGDTLVTRGLRLHSGSSFPMLGVLEGVPEKAARDQGRSIVPSAVFQDWLERQEARVAQSFEPFAQFEFAHVLARAFQGPVKRLPVLWGSRGWTLRDIETSSFPDVIVLIFAGAFENMQQKVMRGRHRMQPPASVPDACYIMCGAWSINLDDLEKNHPTMIGILGAVARAWNADATLMMQNSLWTTVTAGGTLPAVSVDSVFGSWIHVLRRPGSSKEALVEALQAFRAWAANQPAGAPHMQALGRAVGEIQKRRDS